ncbi:hypothetical protein BDQ12DRAFT_658417 [Crucibulum laeve]|uniref:ER membrane protein complex subunit 1 n=1 Tax=Crucibulum laeve TaxID=68775 RepID=A0A5C3LJ42_9AGAR|nr:hypothetical protein BDQ12DRAFT_658417 [Crucibulum laeve]
MRLFALFGALLYVASTSWALHESDVGVMDWHKRLVGVPLTGSVATAPTFYTAGNKSLILTATNNNVLAALDSEDGSIAWRYLFEPEDRIAAFYKGADMVVTLSGPGGSTLRTFETLTGEIILEKRMHSPELGHLAEPPYLGKAVAFVPNSSDVYILTNGYTIQHMDGNTGDIKWTWSSPDQSSLVIYSKLVFTSSALYAIGLAKSTASLTLHVTSFSPATGELIHSTNIPSSIENPFAQFTTLTHPEVSIPRAVWLENGAVKSFGLVPKLTGKPVSVKGEEYEGISDIGLGEYGRLVGIKKDGSGKVLKLSNDGLESFWEFKESATSEQHAPSAYAGGIDKNGDPYVVRVYWSHTMKQAVADTFSGHLAEGRGLSTGSLFPFDSRTHGVISHVALSASNQSQYKVISRIVLTTSTGAIQVWEQGQLLWTREESLATIMLAEFVELPEKVVAERLAAQTDEEHWFARVARQLKSTQNLPQYLLHFVKRFVTGSYASASSSAAVTTADAKPSGPLARDAFGFRQVIVAATVMGKVYGIDSSNGDILWSRVLGLGWAQMVGGRVQPVKMFVVKTVSDGGDPEVVLVAQRRADNTLVDTVIFHFNAVTGEDARGVSPADEVFEGLDIISGPIVEAYLLQNDTRVVILLDEYLQVYLYPDTPKTQAAFVQAAPSLTFPLRTSAGGQRRLTGHQVALNLDVSERYVAYPTWTLSLPEKEDISTLIPAMRGPVASLGKVLGNRTTLYKYLNPRLFVLLTASHAVEPTTCGLYVVDSAKGTIVYRVELPSSGGKCDIKTSLTENWLVYHYYDSDSDGTSDVRRSKGYRMVTVELYEGHGVDQKTRSSDMSAYSNETLDLTAYEQAYVFPHAITALAPTSTKFGITSKDLIVATRNNRIQSFPRRLLNPRRPNRKTTAEEAEEYLIPYDPVLPDDPRRVLSHTYEQVANVQQIVTSPALLESTSLVFTLGLDLFLTRVAPSNTFDVLSENFNKVQLVLTVSALAVAIMFTKPMVQRKRLREKWYQ